jgi:hypothetical protein
LKSAFFTDDYEEFPDEVASAVLPFLEALRA